MRNKKGFTLVELLAVIVVLAIIMIIVMPNVLTSMDNARKNSFKVYAQRMINLASAQYQSDLLSNSSVTTKCYDLSTLAPDGTGSYAGYVQASTGTNGTESYKITMADNNYYILNGTLQDAADDTKVKKGNKYSQIGSCSSPTTLTS